MLNKLLDRHRVEGYTTRTTRIEKRQTGLNALRCNKLIIISGPEADVIRAELDKKKEDKYQRWLAGCPESLRSTPLGMRQIYGARRQETYMSSTT